MDGCPGTSGREKELSLMEIPPFPSEIGRAELYGTTKIGTTQGTAYLGPDQAQENVRSWGCT